MATIAMMVGGAIVNALAFTGSNFMFSKLHSDDERVRHDKAIEQLNRAQAAYERQRVAQLDFINKRLREQGHAAKTFTNVDQAIKEYYLATGKQIYPITKPQLHDYYQPTENQKMREIAFIVMGTTIVYFIAQKVG